MRVDNGAQWAAHPTMLIQCQQLHREPFTCTCSSCPVHVHTKWLTYLRWRHRQQQGHPLLRCHLARTDRHHVSHTTAMWHLPGLHIARPQIARLPTTMQRTCSVHGPLHSSLDTALQGCAVGHASSRLDSSNGLLADAGISAHGELEGLDGSPHQCLLLFCNTQQ